MTLGVEVGEGREDHSETLVKLNETSARRMLVWQQVGGCSELIARDYCI